MGFRITSSVDTYQSTRHLRLSELRIGSSAERIASGSRITRGGDDAASLSISQRLRSQALGSVQGRRNAQAGMSMVQAADGALQQVHVALHRMRELATRAASDSLTDTERGALSIELQATGRSIDLLGEQTEFNGHRLFSATSTPTLPVVPPPPPPPSPTTLDPTSELDVGVTISAGGGGLRTATITAIDVSGAEAGATYTFGVSGGDITLTRSSDGVVDTFNPSTIAAMGTETVTFASLGVSIMLFSVTGMNTSRLRDALTDPSNDVIVTAPSVAPPPPPPPPPPAPATPAVDGPVIGIGPEGSDTVTVPREALSLEDLGLDAALVQFRSSLSRDDAAALGDLVDLAVASVSGKRARLGAIQNRLQHAAAYLEGSEAQLAQSNSRLADADVAAEAVDLARSNISRQIAAGIIAQAQLSSGRVLTLLTGAA